MQNEGSNDRHVHPSMRDIESGQVGAGYDLSSEVQELFEEAGSLGNNLEDGVTYSIEAKLNFRYDPLLDQE
jgi:hypothetical protein